MPTNTISSIKVYPDFILHERGYAEELVAYDPDTGVLRVLRDRLTQPEDIAIVLPADVEGHALTVTFDDGSEAAIRDGALELPPVAMFGELECTLGFTPPATEARPPTIKVRISIRVRPTGGG